MTTLLRCAVSPDPDDRFMFWAIETGRVDTRGLVFELTTADTDHLNRMAQGDGPDISAISIAHYPKVAANYQLFRHGASVGRGYGPAVVALVDSPVRTLDDLRGRRVAVPGTTTTAWLVLCWITAGRANSTGHAPDAPRFTPTVTPILTPIVPYRLTFDALRSGEVDAALLIHEGRLSFPDEGCRMIADIGLEWAQRRALPLPLGGNVIRRGLSRDVRARADAAIRDSIAYALDHRDEAMGWLTATGVALADRARLDRYLGMYANRDTLDMGDDGCAGVRAVLAAGEEMGWFTAPTVDFVQTARP